MEENKKKKSWHDFFVVPLLIGLLIILVGGIIGGPIYRVFSAIGDKSDNSFYTMFGMYLTTIGGWVFCLLYMWIAKYNRPIFKALWTRPKGNNIKMLLLGLLVGFAMNMICAIVAILHKDIVLSYDKFRPVEFFSLLIAVFIQSSEEELICRGFVYQRLRKGYKNPLVAIIINSVFFAALHLGNNGMSVIPFLQIMLIGLLFSLMVYYFDSIWFPMAVHCAWNFTQNILLGLPNSGIVSQSSTFTLDAASATDSFAYSVSFGLEGTATAVLVALIACIIVWRIGKKKSERDLDVWNEG